MTQNAPSLLQAAQALLALDLLDEGTTADHDQLCDALGALRAAVDAETGVVAPAPSFPAAALKPSTWRAV